MSLLIKKVFSPKLVKSYYIAKTEHPPVNGIPCFSLNEIAFIKKENLTTEELEYLYTQKLLNSSFSFLPKDPPLPVGTVIPKEDHLPPGTRRAMNECLNYIFKEKEAKEEEDEFSLI